MNTLSPRNVERLLRMAGIIGSLIVLSNLFLPWIPISMRYHPSPFYHLPYPGLVNYISTMSIFQLIFSKPSNVVYTSLTYWGIVPVLLAIIPFILSLWQNAFRFPFLRLGYLAVVCVGIYIQFTIILDMLIDLHVVWWISNVTHWGVGLPFVAYFLMLIGGVRKYQS